MTRDPTQIFLGPDKEAQAARAWRARGLAALAKGRVDNVWLRLAASVIVACVAVSVLGHAGPLLWLVVSVPVFLIEHAVHLGLYKRCTAGDPPQRMLGLIAWTAIQSTINNVIAAMLWFAEFAHGETLAVIFLFGGLANAAATLRASTPLALAGASPTIAFLVGLPIADFALSGGANTLELMPLVGALLFLGFAINLWKSLKASDVAVAQAEQAAARERQAAAAAAAAKSDTIRRMRDELRTPMTTLIGAAEHLQRAAQSPEARAAIGALVQSSEVLKLVLDDLADLDRLENGDVKIERRPTDPRDLARGVVAAFRTAAHDKNLELFLDIDAALPGQVDLDPLRVRQILANLISNAVRHTSHGGVRVRVQSQATGADTVKLGFTVADTGAGMSRSQLALVFNRTRITGEGEGPGLGLAISMRLAKLMGGQLAGKSDLGQGSVFSLVIEAPVVIGARSSAA